MKQVIEQYVKSCDKCQKRGKPLRNEQIIPIKVQAPFQKIGIDIKGPLPLTDSGKRYLIVAQDYLTKWSEVKAGPRKSLI